MRRLVLAACLVVAGCATTQTYVAPLDGAEAVPPLPAGDPAHVVYLAGNTADLGSSDPVVLRALAAQARADGDRATVVILGDLTASGLPPADAPDRARAEAPVQALIGALSGLDAEILVVPGDRDWGYGEDGLKRLEDLLEEALDGDVLTPGDQAGGPREDDPAEGLRLVTLDTAWWLLDPEDRPEGEAEDQDIRTAGDVARIFEQIVRDRDDDRIVVLAHHPLLSRGPRAGYRSNPLSALVTRTVGAGRQDLASTRYRGLRASLGRIAGSHDRLVWAAAHDRILQSDTDILSPLYQQVHLISGTAGGQTDAFGRGAAEYLSARPGFQRLTYYADGQLWAETVELDAAGQPVVVYRTEVAGINPELVDDELPDTVDPADLPDTVGGTVTATANDGFVTDRFQNDPATRAILGRNYRNVWKTPVAFEVLDMGTEAGGLTPVKRGGGLQTTGLRLLGGDGNEYGIRLLEKSGLAQVPGELRGGLVGDVVLELRAAMNPYGALVASPLARAAGVAQPDPRLVWVPDDPRLGRYRETFGDRLALFEVRPNDDLSDVPGFEGMTDIVSAADLREEMREDQDHRVDQRAFLRARLLDMFIADWDRHSDQWRWAAFEPGDLDPSLEGDEATRGKVYVPVARDRDFSFYGLGGLLQPLLQAFDNRLQAISETYGSVEGLTHNGFIQDRRFLNELTLADWRATAEDVQARLTDDVIEQAVRALPEPIYTQLADYWIGALKGRRDRLVEAAEAYYGFQSPTVDVIGSDEEELVEADRQRDGSLAVTIHSFKDGERGALLYQRTFQPDETDEVRIYGFAGDDTFRITGDGPRSISVRVIGGAGDDQLAAPGGNVAVYDTRDGLELTEDGPRVEDRRSFAPDVNRYDPTEVVLSQVRTVPLFGIQATDGALIGLGRQWLVPGFRLKPFAATHTLRANVATATGGVAASYRGVMREAIGRSTLTVEASGSTPRYARNFYGLGNGSPEIEDDAARVNLARLQARAGLGVPLGQGLELTIGPEARYADAARPGPEDPASTGPPSRLLDEAFDAQTHVGGFAWIEASVVDLATNPRQGARLHLFGEGFAGASGPASAYGRVGGEAALYVPFRLQPQLTLALRASGEHVFGGFPFFDAAVIGGPSSLRGYRRQRFAGRTAAMASAELRAKVLDLDIYVLPLQVGLLGFADAGRVWSDTAGECARVTCTAFPPLGRATFGGDGIQLGYGGGLWFGALDRAVFNVTVGASDEAVLISAGLGFAY